MGNKSAKPSTEDEVRYNKMIQTEYCDKVDLGKIHKEFKSFCPAWPDKGSCDTKKWQSLILLRGNTKITPEASKLHGFINCKLQARRATTAKQLAAQAVKQMVVRKVIPVPRKEEEALTSDSEDDEVFDNHMVIRQRKVRRDQIAEHTRAKLERKARELKEKQQRETELLASTPEKDFQYIKPDGKQKDKRVHQLPIRNYPSGLGNDTVPVHSAFKAADLNTLRKDCPTIPENINQVKRWLEQTCEIYHCNNLDLTQLSRALFPPNVIVAAEATAGWANAALQVRIDRLMELLQAEYPQICDWGAIQSHQYKTGQSAHDYVQAAEKLFRNNSGLPWEHSLVPFLNMVIQGLPTKAAYSLKSANVDWAQKTVPQITSLIQHHLNLQDKKDIKQKQSPIVVQLAIPNMTEQTPPTYGKGPQDVCFYCKQLGHWKDECPNRRQMRGRGQRGIPFRGSYRGLQRGRSLMRGGYRGPDRRSDMYHQIEQQLPPPDPQQYFRQYHEPVYRQSQMQAAAIPWYPNQGPQE
uniref:Gag polyprotein n=1 Tax=Walleye epidermal hyperplasia virus 2 TaxID=64461 RepID=Q9WHJ1_9RETR|nr:gag polyprotein [Walleye epidermal hyperplasia virus 2]